MEGKGERELEDRGTMFLRNIDMNLEEHKLNNDRNKNLNTETEVLGFAHRPVI
jgi:hypothetical protein